MPTKISGTKTLSTLAVIGLLAVTGCSSSVHWPAPEGEVDPSAGSGGAATEAKDHAAEFDEVFVQDHVAVIHIDFDDPAAYSQMVAAAKQAAVERPHYSATFSFDDEEPMTQVGVRFKGNSSLWMSGDEQMKSFKIHFEEYVDGQRLHLVDSLSLNNNFKDPSIMRERLAYRLANELGLEAPRTAYAEVWVDGERHGVDTMVQQVDKRFLKERFGTEGGADDGNLYKCYDDCPLDYRGDHPMAYQLEHGGCDDGDCGLQLKTNEDDSELNDYEDLIEFTKTIQEFSTAPPGPPSSRRCSTWITTFASRRRTWCCPTSTATSARRTTSTSTIAAATVCSRRSPGR